MGLVEGWKHGNAVECNHESDVHEPPEIIYYNKIHYRVVYSIDKI